MAGEQDDRPYAFTFWESPGADTPGYIELARQTQARNLAGAFRHVHLDFSSAADWVPERDLLWEMSKPATDGRSQSSRGRHLALFSGMLRVALLKGYGGLWIDADTIVFPSISPLARIVEENDLCAGETAEGELSNAVMGARPGSAFMERYWAAVIARIRQKQDSGDNGAGWGEFGFRLAQRILLAGSSERVWIAPFGMLVNFDFEQPRQTFEATSLEEGVAPFAIVLSLFNNAIGPAERNLAAGALGASDTLIGHAFRHAMGTVASDHLMALIPDVLDHFDRSRVFYAQHRRFQERTEQANELRERLRRANQRIQQLRTTADSVPARQTSLNPPGQGPSCPADITVPIGDAEKDHVADDPLAPPEESSR